MPEELPRPHRRLDLRPHLHQASRAPAREEPRPPRRSHERCSTTSRKMNMVPPREASPPVASGLPSARSGDHERAPPPSSLPAGAIMDIAASICHRRWMPPPRSGQKLNPDEILVPDPAFPKLSTARV